MTYICVAPGGKILTNVNNEPIGIQEKRALYYAKSVGKHRIYRSGADKPHDKDFRLLVCKTETQATKICKEINGVYNDNFKPEEYNSQ